MKYELVQWPDSQMLMDNDRFNECLLVDVSIDHEDVGSSAYMCPEDLYNEIFGEQYTWKDYALELEGLIKDCRMNSDTRILIDALVKRARNKVTEA